MNKLIYALAGLSMALAAGAASAQSGTNGGSGTNGSGTAGTAVDVIGALIVANNPSVTRSNSRGGGLANAICRVSKSC
jgi:hypothetical protein